MKRKTEPFQLWLKEMGTPFYMLGLAAKISKSYILLTVLIAVFGSVQSIGSVWMTRRLIDGLTAGFSIQTLVPIALFLTVFNLCFSLARRFSASRQAVLADSFKDDFKRLVGEKIMSIQYAHLENPQTLDLKERALRPVIEYGVLDKMLTDVLPTVLNGLFLLVSTAVIVSVSFPLLLLPLLLILALNALLLERTKQVKNMTYDVVMPVERKIGYYTGLTFDYSLGKDIRLYSMQKIIMDKIRRLNTRDLQTISRQFGRISRYTGLSALLSQGQMFLIYGYIGYRVLFHAMSVADFTFYTGIFLSFSGALFSILGQFSEVAYMGKFFSAYREFEAIPNHAAQPAPEGMSSVPFIEFRNVSFTYPGTEKKALDSLSFTIRAGERVALVGRNGAGKTTVIKLLCGLYEPDSGEIWVNGKKSGTNVDTAAVFQDYKLFAFTVYDNIVMGKAENADISEPLRQADLYDAVAALPQREKTYLYRIFEENGVELSGGQGQRLAIARALYKNAPVMILDEPTAALDPIAEQEIFDTFGEISAGKTALLISHRLSGTKQCDRVFVMDDGKITEAGTHTELMQAEHGLYRQMYETQAKHYNQ